MAENITLARPYAEAAFQHAQQANGIDQWSTSLQTLAAVSANEDVLAFVSNPAVAAEDAAQVVLQAAGSDQASGVDNFVRLLAENGRLDLFSEIADLFNAKRNEVAGVVDAVVTSAIQLTDAQRDDISAKLKTRLGRDVRLKCEIDESLIGGAVVQAGDLVIDGSVKTKLEKLSVTLGQ